MSDNVSGAQIPGGSGPGPAPGNPAPAKAPARTAAPVRELAGHNRISTQALTSVAKAAAAEVLAVPPAQVRVGWNDDGGLLALSISSAIGAPSLGAVSRNPARLPAGGSILARATAAKASILAQVEQLSGSRLSRVDVRISGLLVRDDGRVS